MSSGNVRFQCPFCGQISEGSAQYAGTESSCPTCGKRFQLKAMAHAPRSNPSAWACYLGMFKRYVGFRGRSLRREYWWAMLFHVIVLFVVAIIDSYCSNGGTLFGIYLLATLFPLTALQVRRLHDTNKSGWWLLLSLMPVLNLAYLVWMATNGDRGDNRFGKDPRVGE